jgi:predicted Zn-ribbon and HTH transcriptional regulator
MVRLPWWSVWIASLAVAGIYYIWWRRARLLEMRVRNGLCIRCGYDLRESPGRCPECGRDPGKN